MNFLQMGRISLESVAENIMTCLSCGVILKMSCTSPRMSAQRASKTIGIESIALVICEDAMFMNLHKIISWSCDIRHNCCMEQQD